MDLRQEHLSYKKQIGNLHGKPVIELATTGGLHMVVCSKSGVVETLGTGPHKAVARYIAEQREPDITWTELSKADYVEPSNFAFVLPRYQTLTDAFRRVEGSEKE